MQVSENVIRTGYGLINDGKSSRGTEKFRTGSFAETLAETKAARMNRVLGEEEAAPYSYLAKDGIIEYNGVTFVCDNQRNRICLGDVNDPKKCLNIPLSEGGALVVNKDNLGDLSKAIGMFSPEDVKRIMEALAQNNKTQEMQREIDDTVNSIAEI